jgi:hypothetical protein
MKNIEFYKILICFGLLWLTYSCENSADQTQNQNTTQTQQLSPRTVLDECEDCPIGCCCCGIENVSPTMYTLNLCGLCEGDYHCSFNSPGSPCSGFSGLGKDISFNSGHVKEIFCVEPGGSFRISNPNGYTVYFRFSCQYDQVGSSFLNVSIDAYQSKYFHVDGDCIREGCN